MSDQRAPLSDAAAEIRRLADEISAKHIGKSRTSLRQWRRKLRKTLGDTAELEAKARRQATTGWELSVRMTSIHIMREALKLVLAEIDELQRSTDVANLANGATDPENPRAEG